MTKSELKEYRLILAEIRQIENEIERIETLMGSPASPNISGMPTSGQKTDKIGECVARLSELEDLLYDKRAALLMRQMSIERAISTLEIEERAIFRYRYFIGLKWEDICAAMHYSWSVVHQKHRSGLIKLADYEGDEK